MTPFSVTSSFLALAAGAILAFLFSVIPGLNTWYAGLVEESKNLFMAGLIVFVAAVMVLLGCNGIIQTDVVCTQAGIVAVVWYVLVAISSNKISYPFLPKSEKVQRALAIAKSKALALLPK
jgi:hypothetical protein